jgi:predicted metal-dependent hydrolase
MKKRSKTEVEIRNILSEMLLHSLRSGTEIKILDLILKYCKKTRDHSINRIYLKDLLEKCAELERIEFNRKKLSEHVLLMALFVFGPGNSIRLKSRCARYQTFICRKSRGYLKLISRLKTLAERIDDELEDKVKVGAMLFNGGFFFECHEYLEEIWLKEKGREKSFLKGLIHACVAFYHLEYENIKGAENYLKRSYTRLEEFQPTYLGIDVKRFLSDIEKALKVLEESKPRYIDISIPRIKLIKQ